MLVILANLIILGGLFFLRHVIAIRAPVLFMAVGISIALCVLYPVLVARISYPQVLYLYAALILAGAGVLYTIENKFFAPEEIRRNEISAAALGDVLVAVEGAPAVDFSRETFPVFIGASPGNIQGEEPRDLYSNMEPAAEALPEAEILLIGPPSPLEAAPAEPAEEEMPAALAAGEVPELILPWDTPEAAIAQTVDQQPPIPETIEGLLDKAFDALGSGEKYRAAEIFFKALKLNPGPKLAVMICLEMSSIYLSRGRKGQALAVMEMLWDVWGPMLDEVNTVKIKTILIQLRREVQ